MHPTYLPNVSADLTQLVGRLCINHLGEGQACLLFCSQDSAEACREFLLSEKRAEKRAEPDEVEVKSFDFRIRLWATVFPAPKMEVAVKFWQDPGTGISSRVAKDCLDNYDSQKLEDCNRNAISGLSMDDEAFDTVRSRIAALLSRSMISTRPAEVKSSDVFLYPTGMAAIYQLHRYLQRSSAFPGTTVLFGSAFHSTPHLFEEYSSTFRWFGKADDQDFGQLEDFCVSESTAGRPIQAVWAEFPSNPNLRTPDLKRLRALADKFGFLVIIDDTISSFCNVDLVDVADVLVTSLTKSFSGYADVMGGSVVLNPNGRQYSQLKHVCQEHFVNELFSGDVQALQRNSRDYFERSKKLNDNGVAVAKLFQSFAHNPSSAVSAIAHPSLGPGKEYYEAFMRPATSEFAPGYGCLLSVEFESIESTVAFYDNLQVHQGPHLGANLSLALPYVKAIHSKEMAWMSESGMNERMVRISVGLEETDELLRVFTAAVEEADAVRNTDPLDRIPVAPT